MQNKLLIKSIELLASNSDVQRRYLREIGTFPSAEELALEFDDAYKLFIGQVDSNFPYLVRQGLSKIDSLFDSNSDKEDKTFWLESSLDNNSWSEVRDIASLILKEINHVS
jgi:hypothetical protein